MDIILPLVELHLHSENERFFEGQERRLLLSGPWQTKHEDESWINEEETGKTNDVNESNHQTKRLKWTDQERAMKKTIKWE